MRYFIIAGEASGDLHGAALIEALRAEDPEAAFTFLGGDRMTAAAGCEPVIHNRDMAFMGFSEVLRNLGKIFGNMRRTRRALAASGADCLILIDYPSFNLKVAKTRAAGLLLHLAQDMGVERVARKGHQEDCRPYVLHSAL